MTSLNSKIQIIASAFFKQLYRIICSRDLLRAVCAMRLLSWMELERNLMKMRGELGCLESIVK